MTVAFRVDASNRIGTGHVMRCLTVAHALRQRSARCLFLHRQHEGHLCGLIEQAGFEVAPLPKPDQDMQPSHAEDYAAWLGVPWQQDAEQCLALLAGRRPQWLVVDHYGLDAAWEGSLRSAVDHILVVDDLANRPHDCDLLVDQNYFPDAVDRYRPLVGETTPVLAGPRYALLAGRYAQTRAQMDGLPRQLRRILVYYGGVDASNETARALRVLGNARYHELQIDVVVGPNNPHRAALEPLAEKHPRMTIHGPQTDLVDFMRDADLTLGAGGATTWERCALGLPSIVTSVAANQEPYNRLLQADGIVKYLGGSADVTDETLCAALDDVIENPEQLHDMAARAWRLVDGWGTERIVERMLPGSAADLHLRSARLDDMPLTFFWANDPDTRRCSFSSAPIDWESHQRWFQQRLSGQGGQVWICETANGLPIGEVRVDISDGQAVLGFVMDPDFRRRGWCKPMLERFADYWMELPQRPRLIAEVKADNEASAHLLQSLADFRPIPPSQGGWAFALEN